MKDSPGWDGGRSNGFVNGYHDGRMNGTANFVHGPPRNDRGGRGGFRGNRNGGSFNQPMHNAGESFKSLGNDRKVIVLQVVHVLIM